MIELRFGYTWGIRWEGGFNPQGLRQEFVQVKSMALEFDKDPLLRGVEFKLAYTAQSFLIQKWIENVKTKIGTVGVVNTSSLGVKSYDWRKIN